MPVLTGSHLGAGQAWRECIFCSRPWLFTLSAVQTGMEEQERLEVLWDRDLVLPMLEASSQFAA